MTHLCILFLRQAEALARQERSSSIVNFAKERRDEKRLKELDAVARINSYAFGGRRLGTGGGKKGKERGNFKVGMKMEVGDGPPTARDVVESLKEERAMEEKVKREREEVVNYWRRNGYMRRVKKVKGEDEIADEIESVLSADLKMEEVGDTTLVGGGMEDPLELSGDEEDEEESEEKEEVAANVKEEGKGSKEEEDEGDDDNGDYSYWEALMDAAESESAKTGEE